MWSYYGAKTNLIHLYPPPKYGKIIEPFAGSARYSLKYFDREVLLVDKYEVVVKIWKWLKECSPKDILSLPRFDREDNLNDHAFDCIEAKWFMGFIIGCGAERPRTKPTERKTLMRPNHQNYNLKRIAGQLFKIRHWQIEAGTFEEIPSQEATWFIDPPYEFGGHAYVESNKNIDFEKLAFWCRRQRGQVIVCENTKAKWMDFKPVKLQRGSVYKTTEAIWSNIPTSFDTEQLKLNVFENL